MVYTLVILATWEAEREGSQFKVVLGKVVESFLKTNSLKSIQCGSFAKFS